MKEHGGWWKAENYYQIVGPSALQFHNGAYMKVGTKAWNLENKYQIAKFYAKMRT